MIKILIVDDEVDLEPLMVQKFRNQIREKKYTLEFAHNGIEALEKLKQHQDIGLVITDINMPEMDGLTLLAKIAEQDLPLKAIVVSAYGDMDNIRTAMNRGAFDFVTKPVDFKDLELTIERTIEHINILKSAADAQSKLLSINHELHVASRLQKAILPKEFPNHNNIDLHAIMEPAAEIGGDFYDFFWLDEERIGLVIADVSGKGITAALFMAVARTRLKAMAEFSQSPSQCLEKVNRDLCHDNETAMFVTVFYGMLNVNTGEFSYCNAGHCLPIVLHKNGKKEFLENTEGMGLGVFEESTFEEKKIVLDKDSAIFMYTDGITESINKNKEEYGGERVINSFDLKKQNTMKNLIDHIVKDVQEFANGMPQFDDMTCLAVYRKGS